MRRLVHSDVIPNLRAIRDLRTEAEAIEAWYGPNAYSNYLRKHGKRPTKAEAAGMGRLMGGRVKADDGSMQPPLSAADRAALKGVKARRKAFARRFERIARLKVAIATLAENNSDPAVLFGDEISLLDTTAMVAELDAAVCWLNRFAEYWHGRKAAAGTPDDKCFCGD